jgi:hypothetical protein
MYQKSRRSILFVFVLVFAGYAAGADIQWDKGGQSPLWNVPANWNPDGVPTAADTARLYLPDANCVIDSTVAAECTTVYVGTGNAGTCYLDMTGGTLTTSGHIRVGEASNSNGVFIMSGGVASSTAGRLWVGMNGTGTFIMRGGVLNAYDKIEVGKNASGNGTIYVQGGTMNFTGNSTDLEIGSYGKGTLHMTGGVINLQGNIKLSQGNATTTTGVGRLLLYGGTLNAGNLRNPADGIFGSPLLDITEGTLTLPGDYRAIVAEYISRGWLVGYGGLGVVDVNYTTDPNRTTVTASNLPPELAWNPSPRNMSTAERTGQGPVLAWTAGSRAASHDVYFGTDPNAVRDANNVKGTDNVALWAEFKGNQDPCSYNPGPLELSKTYYWRIDEVDQADPNSPWKGVVWEFKTADYVVVDDFESYNDIPAGQPGSKLIYMTWIDGFGNAAVNGSTIGYVTGNSLEPTRVHGGRQSVPLAYDNTKATYSEVTVNLADLGIGANWAADKLKVLSLWVSGSPINAPTDRMYVKVNGAKALYSGLLNLVVWQEWSIDLAALGIDLSNVTTLAIGFERTGPAGGSGSVLIDDIRLRASGG